MGDEGIQLPPLLPSITVSFNAISACLLVLGYRAIKAGDRDRHRRFMVSALCSSAAFLAVYLLHHYLNSSIPYPFYDWTRTLYFIVLVPHVIIAAIMVPFILWGVWFAVKGREAAHAKLMRIVWPVWMYVSVSGVVVYLMLYIQPLLRAVPEVGSE